MSATHARTAFNVAGRSGLMIAVTPARPNGRAPGRAVLVTDGVEAALSWRRASE